MYRVIKERVSAGLIQFADDKTAIITSSSIEEIVSAYHDVMKCVKEYFTELVAETHSTLRVRLC